MTEKMWSGRFTKSLHATVEQFTASIMVDHQLAEEDILGSMAHLKMLSHCQIISSEEQACLQDGLLRIADDLAQGKISFNISDEDIHMNIERLLTQRVGDVAKKLHTARSRNDQVALDSHLYLRKHIVDIAQLITQLQMVLLTQAELNQQVILPGYTHLQRAQPIRLAQHFLAYVAMLERDCQRLIDSWQRVNLSPLGACALAGTGFAIDPMYTAHLLGFDGIYTNSMDAVSDRDYMIEFMAAASMVMMHLSRLCEELVLWSSQELNFIELDDAYCTGSSIMPQKKNPDVPELVRGKSGRVYGGLMGLLTLLKSLPLAYNKDLQEDKVLLFDAVATVRDCLAISIPLLETLTVRADNMRAAASDGFLNATDLADYLAKSGIPFREAHHIVGKIVAYCMGKSCRLEELSLSEFQQFCPQIGQEVFKLLSIETVVEARNSPGSSALNAIAQQMNWARQQIQKNQQWVSDKVAKLDEVRCVLQA